MRKPYECWLYTVSSDRPVYIGWYDTREEAMLDLELHFATIISRTCYSITGYLPGCEEITDGIIYSIDHTLVSEG